MWKGLYRSLLRKLQHESLTACREHSEGSSEREHMGDIHRLPAE